MFGTPTTLTGFGAFGTPKTTQAFGQPAATSNFSFNSGTLFNSQPAAATTTTTSIFGQNPATSTATSGAFNSAAQPLGFGAPSTTFNTGLNFGKPFGTGTAGLSTSFGAPSNPSGTLTGFGAFGTLGTTAPAATTGAFGTGTFGFGKPSSFGTALGTQPTAAWGTQPGLFGTPSATAAQDPTIIATAVTVPMVYQDERDKILALFNQLQAKWGVGKGYHSQSGQAVTFTSENPFCKFKTIGYNALPTYRAEEGLVCIIINKKIQDIRSATPSFTEVLHRDVIKSPNISVFLDSMSDMGQNQTQVVIYVYEKSPTGTSRKFSSSELLAALEQPSCKTALSAMGVVNMAEMIETNKVAVQQYLSTPPDGIDPILWDQAKADNPNPAKLIPVPLVGFEDLARRMKYQREHQEAQTARLELMTQEATELEKRAEIARARVEEFRVKQQDIAHRVLKLMSTFEVNRKMGLGIQSEEETLKASLEEIIREMEILNHGKLCDLQANVKLATKPEENQSTTPVEAVNEEVINLLVDQQKGFSSLITIIKDDLQRLDEILKYMRNTNA